MSKVYIAGPMTGLPNFNRQAFHDAALRLRELGHVPLNPALLPDGLDEQDYMDICLAKIRAADACLFLAGWERSDGAMAEFHYAKKIGKCLMFETAEVTR